MSIFMMFSTKVVLFVSAIAFIGIFVEQSQADPSFEMMGGFDVVGVCVRNCGQCKSMLGLYFNGPLCAESCFEFKGKMIPDCENVGSILPYLEKLEK